jgi:hypothetical protein
VGYVEHALANPDLYRVMFDDIAALPDPAAAGATFDLLVQGARAAQAAGRFAADVDPADVALRYWASGHGLTSLTVSGVLPAAELRRHAPATEVAIFIAAGDDRAAAEASVAAAWG